MLQTQENTLQPTVTTHVYAKGYACSECGKQPFFSHTTDASYIKITEQLVCKSCGFREYPKEFLLQ